MPQENSLESRTHTGVDRFMAACNHQQPDATPVWFMRQAGRCLEEYRELRKKYDILTMAKTPDLCTQVTLMPVHLLGVDGAVLYADIMLPLEGMGVSLEIKPDVGPIIHNPIRAQQDVDALHIVSPEEGTPYVLEATSMVKRELSDKTAVIGFAGAPFTLACYLIEGKPTRDYANAKALMYGQPSTWHALMEKLTTVTADYLVAQVKAGADVVQLFDSWVGNLSPSAYREYVFPYSQRIFQTVKEQTSAPTIHFGTGNASLIELMSEAGADIVSVDSRVDLDDAWKRIGYNKGIQGNLDSTRLIAGWDVVEAGMRDVLSRVGNRPGHIFNLGHGVLQQTDPSLLKRLVEAVHEESAR